MKRLITLCAVLTALALIAAPAFAEVQNVKVSGDIKSAGVYRESYDLDEMIGQNSSEEENNFIITQARVRIDADLTDNVMATVRLLTEYDWDTENNTGVDTSGVDGDGVDLDLANVTLKEAFYAPLTVIVGRQELRYGNAFVIGDPDTNTTAVDPEFTPGDLSLRKSFDAVRAIFDYNPLVVDVIYAKIDETNATNTDEDLYGVNVAYDIGNYDSEIEAYWFWNDNDIATTAMATTTTVGTLRSGNSIYTYGVRGSVAPIDNLNLLAEIALQKGDFDSESATKRDQDALAYQIAGDYGFSDIAIPWVDVTLASPSIRLGWTHYSGEETDNTGEHEAWLPLYEDQSHGVVANFILGGVNGGQNSNADILNVGGSLSPLEDLTLSVDYYCFWLDEKLVKANNQQVSDYTALGWTNLTEANHYMKADDDLGYEIDLALNYDYTEDVKMGFSMGYFKPGDAFDGEYNYDNNKDESAIQALATLDVSF